MKLIKTFEYSQFYGDAILISFIFCFAEHKSLFDDLQKRLVARTVAGKKIHHDLRANNGNVSDQTRSCHRQLGVLYNVTVANPYSCFMLSRTN